MKTIQEYADEIKAVLGMPPDHNGMILEWETRTPKEAKVNIAQIRQIQKELRLIKREISHTIKEIRANYKYQMANVQAGFLATIAGRKSAGQDRARKKLDIRQNEYLAVSPYEDLIQQIEKILVQLDSTKLEIERGCME